LPVSWLSLPVASELATETQYTDQWIHWPIHTVGGWWNQWEKLWWISCYHTCYYWCSLDK
jgi:hypothetical protein